MATFWKELAAVVLSVVSVCAVAFFVALLSEALAKKTIAIAPIAVPRMLEKNGYTAEVVAQRLRDALNNFVRDAQTITYGSEIAEQAELTTIPNVALQADLPTIVVPAVGLSLETIAADIRTFFQITDRRWNISGELTIAQEKLWLRLRMNGRELFTSPIGVDPEHPDELLLLSTGRPSCSILAMRCPTLF